MPRNFVSLFGSGGDVLPAAGGGGGVAPSLVNSDVGTWDNVDSTNAKAPLAAPSVWNGTAGNVLVLVVTYDCINNTDTLAGSSCIQFAGTGACVGGYTTKFTQVSHSGARSTMVGVYTGTITTPGTFQLQMTGGTLAAGATRRHLALMEVHNLTETLDGTAVGAAVTVSPAQSGNIITTGAGMLIGVMCTENTPVTLTKAASWTELTGANDTFAALQYLFTTGGVTDQAAFTMSGAANGDVAVIAFKSTTP